MRQRSFDGLAQLRNLVPNDFEHEVAVDAEVLVREHVPHAANPGPRDRRQEGFDADARQLRGSLADVFEPTSDDVREPTAERVSAVQPKWARDRLC